jgi:hypothetical protein
MAPLARGGSRQRATPASATKVASLEPYVRLGFAAAARDLTDVEAILDEIADPPDAQLAVLRKQAIANMVSAALRHRGASARADAILAGVDSLRRRPAAAIEDLRRGAEEAVARLASVSVEAIILKGIPLAERLYGDAGWRAMHDVDLLVRRKDRGAAVRILTAVGYEKGQRDQHAVNLHRPPVSIDLHWALRASPAYRLREEEMWSTSIRTNGTLGRLLSDDYLLMLLSVSLAEDAGLGMAKVKHVCDLWCLVRALDATVDWPTWLASRSMERTDRVAVAGLSLALSLADDPIGTRRCTEALSAYPTEGRPDRRLALELLTEPRRSALGEAWFARIYPGSITRLRVASLVQGFPHSLREIRLGRATSRMVHPIVRRASR